MTIVTCSAAYGTGGLGQHFTQVVEEFRGEGQLAGYYSLQTRSDDDAAGHRVAERYFSIVSKYTPVRFSPGWKNYCLSEFFDRATAKALAGPIDEIICFGGQALHSFRRARDLGAKRLHLMAANSHVENVQRLHDRAIARDPLESSWLNQSQIAKTLKEYALADFIHVASEYTRQTFLKAGFPESKLIRMKLATSERFQPGRTLPSDGTFRMVYTGSLTVMKGIPLLIDAFTRLNEKNSELILVGGWATRGMKTYLKAKMASDPRIKVAPGDPLPHLQKASVFVHPSWEDGWAYAPAEALACGVPVIVTEDTGMRELIIESGNGFVIPTGDTGAMVDRLKYYAKLAH